MGLLPPPLCVCVCVCVHNLPCFTLHDVSTRWNSSYFMQKRIIMQQQPICAALIEVKKQILCPVRLSFRPWRLLCKSWNPLPKLQQLWEQKNGLNISAVRPLLNKLLHIHLTEKHSDTRLMKMIKKAVLDKLQGYYTNPVTAKLLNKA